MSCQGGRLSVIANEQLLGRFVGGWRRRGVDARAEACNINPCPCALIIGGGNRVTFVDSLVFNVSVQDDTQAVSLPLALVCVTGAQVTFLRTRWEANGAIALSVRGGSLVRLDQAVMQDNVQGGPDIKGGALASSDANTIEVLRSTITGNNCTQGCGINMAGGTLTVRGSLLAGNNAFQLGGGLLLTRKASARVADSRFEGNTALTDGGGVAVDESALTLANVTLGYNRANRSGGGVHAAYSNVTLVGVTAWRNEATQGGGLLCEQSTTNVDVRNSTFRNNNATTFGGGLMADDGCSLVLAGGSRVEANRVGVYRIGMGGGIHVNEGAAVRLTPGTRVAGNSATRFGGGIRLMSANFSYAEVAAATAGGHNKALYTRGAEDLSLAPRSLSLPAPAAAFVPGQGCQLHVRAEVRGPQGLPSVGEDVEAAVVGFKDATVKFSTNTSGVADLYMRFYQKPGNYTLQVKAPSADKVEARNMTVEVLRCPQGFVHQLQQSDWTCLSCPYMTYSFNPQQSSCPRCPANAECIGDKLWPGTGYWHSSPRSAQLHRCLNPDACKGGSPPSQGPWAIVLNNTLSETTPPKEGYCNLFVGNNSSNGSSSGGRRALLQQQQQQEHPVSEEEYKSSQCSKGYRGNLCGLCAPGYAKVRTHTCRECQQPGTILGLYLLAAAVMLGLMKLVLNFHTQDCRQGPAAAPYGGAAPLLIPQHSARTASSSTGGGGSGGGGATAAAAGARQQPLVGHAIEVAMVADARARAAAAAASAASVPPAGRRAPSSSGGGSISSSTAANNAVGAHSSSGGGAAASSGGGGASGGGASGGGSKQGSTRDQLRQLSPTDIAKPFILYAQYLAIVAMMTVPWPDTLNWPIKVLDWFWATAASHVLSIECLLQHDGRSSVPLAVRKVLVDLCVPLLLLCVLLAIEAALAGWRRRRRSRFGANNVQLLPAGQVVRVCVVVLFFFLPFLVRNVLSLFACIELDKAPEPGSGEDPLARGSWWLHDLGQQCYEGSHRAWAYGLGLPLALLLCLVLPVAIAAFTWSHRGRLSEPRFRQQWSFLTHSYKERWCWWEAVVVCETVLLCMCATFAAMLGTYYQGLLMILAFASMFVLLLCVRPHQWPLITRVTLQGYGALFITAFSVLTFLPFEGVPRPPKQYGLAVGVLVLVVNLGHCCYAVGLILRSVDWGKARAALAKARNAGLGAVSSVVCTLRSASSLPLARSLSSLSKSASSIARAAGSGTRAAAAG